MSLIEAMVQMEGIVKRISAAVICVYNKLNTVFGVPAECMRYLYKFHSRSIEQIHMKIDLIYQS
jgi:hypothetical protein